MTAVNSISTMAKARWADGLRRGSTRTKTYSTLGTRKEGRVQIIKDRVYEVTNPQTDNQMRQRTIFATVTKAAEKMIELIGISQEGESKVEYARQAFISQNIAFLKSVAGRTEGDPAHVLAAYAPKGNQQLIPNSYIVSKGSLTVPTILLPKTNGNKGSFGANRYAVMGNLPGLPFGTYTVAQLWYALFGLQPGDQLSFPQVYNEGIAQVMYNSADEDAEPVDKTILADFVCPRIVLLETMPSTTVTIDSNITAAEIIAAMKSGVDSEKTWETMDERLLDNLSIDDTADDILVLTTPSTYDELYCMNNDDVCVALGVVLSRKVEGKWKYSTSQLVCIWDGSSIPDGEKYFGFTLPHAMDTYRADAVTDADGNFLQRGGSSDIIPKSFM
mgnify:CR=1 FL=1